jgi:hypothetical protein
MLKNMQNLPEAKKINENLMSDAIQIKTCDTGDS